MGKYKVLSTKKLAPQLIDEAKRNDIQITEQEFISIKPIVTKEKIREVLNLVSSGKEYIAFTSANAVTAFDHYLYQYGSSYIADYKIFCLEGKTKGAILNSLLRKKDIIATAKNAEELSQKIIGHGVKEIIFFCGNKRRNDLPDALKNAGITIQEVIVYETLEIPAIAMEDFNAILFFSPSAVNSFFSVNKPDSKVVCFAVGTTTAHSITCLAPNKVITIESPGEAMMIASLKSYFKNINCYE